MKNCEQNAFALACERYAALNVDVEKALATAATVPVSLHCWQGDDVAGFESKGSLSGGIAATGNYPGKARTADELRADLEQALALLPGRHRVSLHAIYADHRSGVPRDELAGTLSKLIDSPGRAPGSRFQPHLLRTPWLPMALTSRIPTPPRAPLDPPLPGAPHRRRHGPRLGAPRRHQLLDSGWLEGYAY